MLRDKLWSVAKGALVAAGGAALAYAAQYVAGLAEAPELGLYGPALAAVLAVAVNAARKALEPSAPDQPTE